MLPIDYEKMPWRLTKPTSLPSLIDDLKNCQWRQVKSTPKRAVYSAGPYYIKVYNFTYFHLLKRFFFNHARKEWRISCRLSKTGANIAAPVAFCSFRGKSYFVTRSVEPCIALSEFCLKEWNRLDKKRKYLITDLFADFIGRLLNAGLYQKDFNLGNILIAGDFSVFFAIDLQRARLLHRTLTDREKAKNLSYLLPCFEGTERRYKLRFFIHLVRIFPEIRPLLHNIQEWAYEKIRTHQLKKSHRKLRLNNNKSHLINTPAVRGFIRKELDNRLISLLSEDPDRLFQNVIGDMKNSKRSRVSLIEWNDRRFIAKRYNLKGLLFRIRRLFSSSFAIQKWNTANLLSIRGIATPTIFASLDMGVGFFYRGTITLHEYIEQPHGNQDFYKNILISKSGRQRVLSCLAFLLRHIHESGIYHGDGKVSNFLWTEKSGEIKIFVIDLDSTRFVRKISDRQRFSDLKNMLVYLVRAGGDKAIIDEFFDEYVKQNPLRFKKRRSWIKKLHKKVKKQLLHIQSRQKR